MSRKAIQNTDGFSFFVSTSGIINFMPNNWETNLIKLGLFFLIFYYKLPRVFLCKNIAYTEKKVI